MKKKMKLFTYISLVLLISAFNLFENYVVINAIEIGEKNETIDTKEDVEINTQIINDEKVESDMNVKSNKVIKDATTNKQVRGVGQTISATFPDPIFAQAVADHISDGDVNAVITQAMIDNCDDITVNRLAVTDVTGIGIFVNLRTLGIANTQITSLPDSIGNLTNLTGLWLGDNNLTSLPESIGNLTNMTRLHVQRNQITSLPNSFANLTSLNWFTYSNNLLPTDTAATLNSLGLPHNTFPNETQSKLILNSGIAPFVIKNQSDLDNINLSTLVTKTGDIAMSSQHSYILEGYIDDVGRPVNIDDYIKNGVVLKNGAVFAKIRAGGVGLFPNNSENAITADTIRLDFELPYYNLVFDMNGALVPAPAVQSLQEGQTGVEVTIPTRDSFVFNGWNTAIDGTGTNWIPGTTPMVAVNTTLYAQWTPQTYNLVFDMNGALIPAPTIQVLEEGQTGVAVANPTRVGFVFNGWNTAIDGTGTNWTPGTTPMVAANTTLYAQWAPQTYNLVFDMNGALIPAPAIQVLEEGQTGVVVANPTRVGFVFNGWNTAIDGTGTIWTPGTTPMVAANTTLYAQWSVNIYNVLYNLDGGITTTPNPSTYTFGIGISSFTPPVKDGYTFLGWYDAAVGGNLVTNISVTSIGDKELYARWEVKNVITLPQTGNSINLFGITLLSITSILYFILKKTK